MGSRVVAEKSVCVFNMMSHKIPSNAIKYKIFSKKHTACEPRVVPFSSQKTEQREIEKIKNN